MNIQTVSHWRLATQRLAGPSAVICIADPGDKPAPIRDLANVRARLNLYFHDAIEAFGGVRPPTLQDARKILRFVEQQCSAPHVVVQCYSEKGRSESVQAALMKIKGHDPRAILREGTYNPLLYRLLLAAAGVPLDPEPLVSINVRVKYAPDRLRLFLLCMKRQRHENWEAVAVTDGPNPDAARLVAELNDSRIRLIQTETPLGLWGHPYRQLGLDACRGEFIGMSNDDNYYVPGYLEQMLYAIEDADFAQCAMTHSYRAWGTRDLGTDLGCWIARASLVRQVPWPGTHFPADEDYIKALKALANDRVATVNRPLFVHN